MRPIQYQGQDDVGGGQDDVGGGRVGYIDDGDVDIGDGLRQDDGTADQHQEQICKESRRRCT